MVQVLFHIAPTFGADDANVARAAGIPSLFMINKKGETRPMVDLTGKFYLLDELDENFVKECVDVENIKEYQGAWVKNAYDPVFMIDGKYDEKAAQAAESLDIVSGYDDESKQSGIQDRKACPQLSALLAYRQTGALLSVG